MKRFVSKHVKYLVSDLSDANEPIEIYAENAERAAKKVGSLWVRELGVWPTFPQSVLDYDIQIESSGTMSVDPHGMPIFQDNFIQGYLKGKYHSGLGVEQWKFEEFQ